METNMVDWSVVERQLASIDDAWKQPKFDSLPHVVSVLTAHEPEAMLQSLSEQRNTIEDLVDDVVLRYHNGFNKAIHNYSQILRLFGESASSMSGLKESLAESRRLLSTRHKHLQQLWYRSVTLRYVLSLLDQIDAVAKVPARIEKLIVERKYFAAVQLYLQSVSMLEREGLQAVGGLREVRADFQKLRGTLFSRIMEDLHLHLYNKGEYSMNLTELNEKEEDLAISLGPNPSAAIISPANRGRSLRTLRQNTRPRVRLGLAERNSGASVPPGTEQEEEGVRHLSQNLPPWLAEATPNDFTESMLKIDAPPNVKYLMTLVECLVMLGKLPASGAIIFQRLRPTVRELIAAEVKARAASAEAARPRVDQVRTMGVAPPAPYKKVVLGVPALSLGATGGSGKAGGGGGGGKSGVGRTVVPGVTGPAGPFMCLGGSAQIAAQELMESVLNLCNRLLENHVVVGETIEAKAAAAAAESDGGGPRPSTADGQPSFVEDMDLHHATGGYSVFGAWSVLQSECQQLVCDILRATPEAAAGDAALTQRLNNVNAKTGGRSKDGEEDELDFAFRFVDVTNALPGGGDGMAMIGGDAMRLVRNRRGSAVQSEVYGTAAALPDRGLYLTSAVYRPIIQFTDKALSLMHEGVAPREGEGLRGFMENFVKDQFLPRVRVDYRTAVSDVLSSPVAFRAKARGIGGWNPSVEKGRPILQGLLFSEQLVQEVLVWAQAMPLFAVELVELVQTLLERVLERSRAVFMQVMVGSLSNTVSVRPDIDQLLLEEPAHRLLDSIFMGDSQGEALVYLNKEEGETAAESELWGQLLALQPIKEEMLVQDSQKLISLAALSDSLDYVADAISQLGCSGIGSGAGGGSGSPTKRARALAAAASMRSLRGGSSSTLTTSLADLMDKYRHLSAECLRALRLEILVRTVHTLQPMSERMYVLDSNAEEPEDFVLLLTSQLSRCDDEMAAYVPPIKRVYIFGGACGLSAQFTVSALASMKAINLLGVRQIIRNCIALQQTLVSLGGSTEVAGGVQLRLDRVRTYYELLSLPIDALLAFVAEHPLLFSFHEYSALLRVNVMGRQVPQEAIVRMGRILEPTRMGSRGAY